MNPETTEKPVWHFGVIFVVACFLFVALVVAVQMSVHVPAIDADRAALRSKALADLRAVEATALTTAGWVDQDRGIVRLPIETAMQISEKTAQNPVAALSGPSFATDVARGLPTAVVVAARDEALAADLAARFSAENLRCYSSDDLIGVEIGGALKNVFAIAAGAVTGAGLGASAQAAMVTRGFVELRRIGAAFGARPETLMGLSGLGDLLLTCSSAQSRNFAYGLALGQGKPLSGLPLAEGVPTAAIAARIASERNIDAPIITAVAAILDGTITIQQAVTALMTRPLKTETND